MSRVRGVSAVIGATVIVVVCCLVRDGRGVAAQATDPRLVVFESFNMRG